MLRILPVHTHTHTHTDDPEDYCNPRHLGLNTLIIARHSVLSSDMLDYSTKVYSHSLATEVVAVTLMMSGSQMHTCW